MTTTRKTQSVSIVVNTFNRCQYLKRLLESLAYLDYDNFEVVVVNGPSTDATSELLSEWESEIKAGHCPEANLSISRNIGIAMAAGEFVAFIDDDAVPEPEWLNQAIDAFEHEDVAAVGGPVFDHTGYNFQCRFVNANRLGNSTWEINHPSPYNCFPYAFEFPYLSGCNVIFRRSVLLEIGGFDEEYEYYLDETDVCVRIVDEGYVVKQLPDSFVHHKYAPSEIREHKVSKYRYPILKNKVYFSNRYGHYYYSKNEIDNDYKVFVEEHRKEIVWAISLGLLTETDLQDFEGHVKDAFIQGKLVLEMPRKLITDKLLESCTLPFKHFQVLECELRPLTIAFLCENNADSLEGEASCIVRDRVADLVALGHKVHVITRGNEHNTVDFEDGIWIHRIMPDEENKSDKAIELNIPQGAWNQSKAFLDELDRISTHRNIDIVQAPIANMIGCAALLLGEYKVITSMSTNDAELIRSYTCSESDETKLSNKTLESIKYSIVINSDGLLADDFAVAKLIDDFCVEGNTYHMSACHTHGVAGLLQDYRKLLEENNISKQ